VLKRDKGKPGAEAEQIYLQTWELISKHQIHVRQKEKNTTKKIKRVNFGTERKESYNKNCFLTAIKIKIS
jgi:curved DNA-binding protein CbpA